MAATMDGPNWTTSPSATIRSLQTRWPNAPTNSTSPPPRERLLGSLDSGQSNIYDGIYGGSAGGSVADMLSTYHAPSFDGGVVGQVP
jgi:hypothetical protein